MRKIIQAPLIIAAAICIAGVVVLKPGQDTFPSPITLPTIITDSDPKDFRTFKSANFRVSFPVPTLIDTYGPEGPSSDFVKVFEDAESRKMYVVPNKDDATGKENTSESAKANSRWTIYTRDTPPGKNLPEFIGKAWSIGTSTEIRLLEKVSYRKDMYQLVLADAVTHEEYPIAPFLIIKYSPDKSRIAFWGLGQDVNFTLTSKDGKSIRQFDQYMADNFNFF